MGRGKFNEGLHPRANNGEFTNGGKGGGKAPLTAAQKNTRKRVAQGAVVGTVLLPGVGTAAGAVAGHRKAKRENETNAHRARVEAALAHARTHHGAVPPKKRSK